MAEPPALILASASRVRARLLANAGVDFDVMASHVDEDSVKESMLADGAKPEDVAAALAELKAVKISARHPDALVLAADQVLELDGALLSKPADIPAARVHLERLSAKSHRLVSALNIAEGGAPVWRHRAQAELTVRPLSAEFISSYLDAVGDAALSSVGCYQLEGMGAQLFSRIEGDYFTVLGLPLLPVLDYLRARRVLPS